MKSALQSCFTLGYGAFRAFRNGTTVLFLVAGASFAAPLTVVALGDSLTQGYGLPQQEGFVPQMQSWLRAQGEDVTLVNAGVSGDTTAGGAARLDWSLSGPVDALIVNLGGNDLLRGLDPSVTRENLDKILQGAKTRTLPVLLVGLQASTNYGPDFKARFDTIYPELAAKYGALLLPGYFDPLMPEGQVTLDRTLMQGDGIHPNADGVKRIVAAMGPKVQELLAEVARPAN
jgi:acyl-CoA thioesterase-1